MKKFLLIVLLASAVALAADVRMGTSSDYAQPMGVRDSAGNVYPAAGTDAGYPLTAPAPGPDGYRRTFSGVVRMNNLESAGSTGYKLTATCYECEVFDESVNMCKSITCTDGGGVRMGTGSRRKVCMDQVADGGADGGATTDWSGWSTSSTGDWVCTPVY